MKKANPLLDFILVYVALISIQFTVNFIALEGDWDKLLHMAVASVSLTNILHSTLSTNSSLLFTGISILIRFLACINLLAFLYWYHQQLFGSASIQKTTIWESFKTTCLASTIAIVAMSVFFMYALFGEVNKLPLVLFSALGLSVSSFANAGISDVSSLINREMIRQSFILQMGIAAGATLGSLGIFVLKELLSPAKLRERMANPMIDWSYLTKIAVFGTIFIFLIGAPTFYLLAVDGLLESKNIVELVFASLYEIASARGYGHFISDLNAVHPTTFLIMAVSIFGAVPFGPGGGLTLLGVVWGFSLFIKNKNTLVKTGNTIVVYLFTYCVLIFSVLFVVGLFVQTDLSFTELLLQQWLGFFNLQTVDSISLNWPTNMFKSATIISGRIGFVLACSLTLWNKKR